MSILNAAGDLPGESFSGIDPHESVSSGGTRLTIFGSFDIAATHACRFSDVRNAMNTPVTVAAHYSLASQLTCQLPLWPYPEGVAAVTVLNVNTTSTVCC